VLAAEADNPRKRIPPMKCPFCLHLEDRVVDSRESREGDVIRRRRECLKCERRFTSYERSMRYHTWS
jgi:transcriptional regulator NrdR family protein